MVSQKNVCFGSFGLATPRTEIRYLTDVSTCCTPLYLTPRIAEAGKVHRFKPFCKIKDKHRIKTVCLLIHNELHMTEHLSFAFTHACRRE